MHPVVTFLLQAAAVCGALITIGAFVERIWSPMRKWLQDALTYPILRKMDDIDRSLRERDDKLAEEIAELRTEVKDHRTFVGAHLGPKVDKNNTPLFERVGHLETQSEALKVQVHELSRE